MVKKISIFLIIYLLVSLIFPYKALALDTNNFSKYNYVYILDDNEGCSLFGNPDDEDSVAWLLQKALDFVRIIGPILVVLLSSIDFIQVIISDEKDTFPKARKKLIWRLVLALLLFFIPLFVEVAFNVFGLTGGTCGLE